MVIKLCLKLNMLDVIQRYLDFISLGYQSFLSVYVLSFIHHFYMNKVRVYSNDDFVSLECQEFLHELYSNNHSLCIPSVICCITGSPFLILLCPLPFQFYKRLYQVRWPSYHHKESINYS